MNIPDEAVEAAARAAVEHFRACSPNLAAGLDGQTEVFRTILEAAAPHLVKDARDGGWQMGYSKGYQAGYAEGVAQVDGYNAGYNHGFVKGVDHKAERDGA